MIDFVDGGPKVELIKAQLDAMEESHKRISEIWRTCSYNQERGI